MKLKDVLLLSNLNERSKLYAMLSNIISKADADSLHLSGKDDVDGFVKAFNSPELSNAYAKEVARSLRDNYYLDIAVDILIQDGHCILNRDKFKDMYEAKIGEVNNSILVFKNLLENEGSAAKSVDPLRVRDYRIYTECSKVAYMNDVEEYGSTNNSEANITKEEKSVLNCLAKCLGFSHDETRCLYLCQLLMSLKQDSLPVPGVDEVIQAIVSASIGIYIKKKNTLYIPEEFVEVLRALRGITVSRKYMRRILSNLSSGTLRNIMKRHQISQGNNKSRLNAILDSSPSMVEILQDDIYPEGCKENEKKKLFNEFANETLKLPNSASAGRTLDEKIGNFIAFLKEDENNKRDNISVDAFEQLLSILGAKRKAKAFEEIGASFDDAASVSAKTLLDYAILPKDILYAFSDDELREVCGEMGIKVFKNMNSVTLVENILKSLVNSEDVYIEHYVDLANNDSVKLVEMGVNIDSKNLGLKFQSTTQTIFERLNLTVGEIKNPSDKTEYADIVLDFEEQGLVIVECKSSKRDYSKFTSVNRQVSSYVQGYMKDYEILGVIIVSNDFTKEFVESAQMVSEFKLCLLKAEDLKKIYDGLKNQKDFKINIENLLRNTVVNPDLVIKGATQKSRR